MFLSFAVWFIVGALIGGVAGVLMRDEDDSGVFVNVLVGVVGALAAGWLVAPRLGPVASGARGVNFGSLAVALVGAIVLLAVVGLVRRHRSGP
jgi:uncharacterized membrane protein YeaQ/YmgE (transglycosylase-associated protein family)